MTEDDETQVAAEVDAVAALDDSPFAGVEEEVVDNEEQPEEEDDANAIATVSADAARIDEQELEKPPPEPVVQPPASKIIPVEIGGVLLSIPIGDGTGRSARWLSTVAAARYAERAGYTRRATGVTFSPVPTAIRILASGELIPPTLPLAALWAKLVSIASAGLEGGGGQEVRLDTGVQVEIEEEEGRGAGSWRGRHLSPNPSLASTLPGFEKENDAPSRSPWQDAAFSMSPAAHSRAVKLTSAARDEVLRAEREAAAAAEGAYTALVAVHLKQLAENFGKAGGDSGQAAVQAKTLLASLESEWGFIRVSSITSNTDEQLKIKATLAVHWADLATVFDRYASSDSGAESGKALQLPEFLHLCCVAGICPAGLPVDSVTQVFSVANEDRVSMKSQGGDDGRTDSMSHFEFLEAVILLGHALYGKVVDPAAGRLGAGGGFTAILHQHLVPLAVWCRTGPLHMQLGDMSMKLWLQPRMGALRAVYAFYSASDAREASSIRALLHGPGGVGKAGAGPNVPVLGATALKFSTKGGPKAASTRHTLSLREFAVLLEHAGLVGEGTSSAVAEYAIRLSKGTATAPKVRAEPPPPEDPTSRPKKKEVKPSGGPEPLVNALGHEMLSLGFDSRNNPILVEAQRHPTPLDPPLVYEAFIAAQLPDGHHPWWSPPAPDGTGSTVLSEYDGGKHGDFLDELTFLESLEAVARIAIARWGHAAGLDKQYAMDPPKEDRKACLREAALQRDAVRKAILKALDDKTDDGDSDAAKKGASSPGGGDKFSAAAEEKTTSKRFRGLMGNIAVTSSLTPGNGSRLLQSFAEAEAEESASRAGDGAAPKPKNPKDTRRGSVVDGGIYSVGPGRGARRGSVTAPPPEAGGGRKGGARRSPGRGGAEAVKDAPPPPPKLYTPPATSVEVVSILVHWAIEAVASVAWHLGQPTHKRPLPMDAHDAQAMATEVHARTAGLLKTMAGGLPEDGVASAAAQAAPAPAPGPGLDAMQRRMSVTRMESYKAVGGMGGGQTGQAAAGSPKRGAGPGSGGGGGVPGGAHEDVALSPAAVAARSLSRAVPITEDPAQGVMGKVRAAKAPFSFKVPTTTKPTDKVNLPGPRPAVGTLQTSTRSQ